MSCTRPSTPRRPGARAPRPHPARRAPRLVLTVLALLGTGACGGSDSGPAEPEEPARPASIQLSESSLSFSSLNESVTITATVLDQRGNPMPGRSVAWSSSDSDVARVGVSGSVRSTGNGSASITATSGSASAQLSVTVAQIATSMELVLDSLVLPWGGAFTTLQAVARDAGGSAVAGTAVTWTSQDAGIASVDAAGVVTGVAQGETSVEARSGEVADTLPVRVASSTPDTPAITAVDPGVVIEGDEAVITGERFGAHPSLNEVVVDGQVAPILSASATELRIRVPQADCLPLRTRELVVNAFGQQASAPVGIQPPELVSLAVGEAFLSDGCIQLDALAGTPGYMIGILSTSEVPSSLTPSGMVSQIGDAVATSGPALRVLSTAGAGPLPPGFLRPIRPASAPAATATGFAAQGLQAPAAPGARPDPVMEEAFQRHWEMEREIRARDLDRIRRLGPVAVDEPAGGTGGAAGARAALQAGPPQVGDVLSVKVPDGFSCSDFTSINADVTLVSSSLIIVEDQDNFAEARLTPEELQALQDIYDVHVDPTLEQNFGPFTDLDGNGRVVVVLTEAVNRIGGLLGFVFSGDFFNLNQCPSSNFGEYFYGFVADPDGEIPGGPRLTKEQFISALAPLVAHENTHVIQFGNQVRGDASAKSTWELEGGATLAEQLAGFSVAGYASGMNLGPVETFTENQNWWQDWYSDMIRYFGVRSSTERFENAPEECSWAGRVSEGNSGPCLSSRAPYGTPAMFLRMVMDRYGDVVAGGESAILRESTLSQGSGLLNITTRTGRPADQVLAEFSIALWADDRVGDWITSWNLASIFDVLGEIARIQPRSLSGLQPEIQGVSVRALSTGYFDWDPGSDHPPVALRLTDGSENDPADHMRFWVLRTR